MQAGNVCFLWNDKFINQKSAFEDLVLALAKDKKSIIHHQHSAFNI